MKNADMPAMPTDYWSGLTKREHFAAMAMQGMLSAGNAPANIGNNAVFYADRLLEALETPQ